MDTDQLSEKRFLELSERCYRENRYTFTDFLAPDELAAFYRVEPGLKAVPYSLWGGTEMAERVMLRFGSEEMFSYEEPFPISFLEIKPRGQKFSEQLTHRDVLGALMSLGITRNVLGDIFPGRDISWVICHSTMVEYISRELTVIRHTPVSVTEKPSLPEVTAAAPEIVNVPVASERIDGIIAKAFDLSRSDVTELFRKKLIFRNGRLEENNSRLLVPGDLITVRGFGRIRLAGFGGVSRKGKQYVELMLYGRRK